MMRVAWQSAKNTILNQYNIRDEGHTGKKSRIDPFLLACPVLRVRRVIRSIPVDDIRIRWVLYFDESIVDHDVLLLSIDGRVANGPRNSWQLLRNHDPLSRRATSSTWRPKTT